MSETDTTKKERKEVYESVLRAIDYNTGNAQLPGVSLPRLKTVTCAHGRWESNQVDSAVQAGVENGDLIKWPGLPFRNEPRYTRTTEEDLRELLGRANEQQQQLEETIKTAAQAIKEVTDDG